MSGSISVVILTFDEELNIEKCLTEAKKITNHIVIVDSYSTDMTLEICKKFDCIIYQNKFVNQAVQLNWALSKIKFETDWILRLDADEYCLPELIDEIRTKLRELDENITGVFLRRRVYFMDKWIRHGGYYPTLLLRVWRNGKAVCENRWMDEHMQLLEGEKVTFKNDFVDQNNKNLHWWIDKHNRYATREAIEQLNDRHVFFKKNFSRGNLIGGQAQRKSWVKKNIYNVIPLGVKPFLYFFYRYILRCGFLDGFRGFLFHVLQGFWYRFLVDAKVYEVERQSRIRGEEIKVTLNRCFRVDV